MAQPRRHIEWNSNVTDLGSGRFAGSISTPFAIGSCPIPKMFERRGIHFFKQVPTLRRPDSAIRSLVEQVADSSSPLDARTPQPCFLISG